MACKITIKNHIDSKVDQVALNNRITLGNTYNVPNRSTLKTMGKVLDKMNSQIPWSNRLLRLITTNGDQTAEFRKDSYEIDKLADKLYQEQLALEYSSKLKDGDNPWPMLSQVSTLSELRDLLTEFGANDMGVIQGATITQMNELSKELLNKFGDEYELHRVNGDEHYVSYKNEETNVIVEYQKTLTENALSDSILSKNKITTDVIMLADKFASRFDSDIRFITMRQAMDFPRVNLESKGFFDPASKTSYLIIERIDKTTTLHEAFSHPFIAYIQKNNLNLYNTLLNKAKEDVNIKAFIDTKYSHYNEVEKEHEYIARALDLEYRKQLNNDSLLRSIELFWKRIVDAFKALFNIETDINKFSTFKDVIDFALNSEEKMDLRNFEIMNLGVMNAYADEEMSNELEEVITDDARDLFMKLRNARVEDIKDFKDTIENFKNLISGNQIVLDENQTAQLDTYTARINSLSSALNKDTVTSKKIIAEPYIAAAVKSIRELAKQRGEEDANKLLYTLSSISQILEEALVITDYVKHRVTTIRKSNASISQKAQEILSYYKLVEALQAALSDVNKFFLESTDMDFVNNGIGRIFQAIDANIGTITTIKDNEVIDIFVDKIYKGLNNTQIHEKINKELERIKVLKDNQLQKLQTMTTDVGRKKINNELKRLKNEEDAVKRWEVNKKNIKDKIEGKHGDTSFLRLWFDAGINSPDAIIAGFDSIIEKMYMEANDETQEAANKMQDLLQRYMEATNRTDADKFNLETFYSDIVEKVEFKKIKTVESINNDGEIELHEELVDVVEDQLIGEFEYAKLGARLDELRFKITQAKKTENKLVQQEAIKEYEDFKRKYFETTLTDAYYERMEDNNIVTEADLKDLYDENGNPFSLEENDSLIYAAKEALKPIYDALNVFYAETDHRVPTEAEWENYVELNLKLKDLSSLKVPGTNRFKEGKDMMIARVLEKSKARRAGVYKFTLHAHAEAKYNTRLAQERAEIEREIAAGRLTQEEAQKRLDLWHLRHSQVRITDEFREDKADISKRLDLAYVDIKNRVPFIGKFENTLETTRKEHAMEIAWDTINGHVNPLRDLDGIPNGLRAQEDLQKRVKDQMEYLEEIQRVADSFTEIISKKDKEEFDRIVRGLNEYDEVGGIYVKQVKVDKTFFPIKSYNNYDGVKPPVSILSKCRDTAYNGKGFKDVLKKYLKPLSNLTDEEGEPLPAAKIKKLQRFIFNSSHYAKVLTVRIKDSLKDRNDLNAEQKFDELKRLLNEELEYILTTTDIKYNGPIFQDFNLTEDQLDYIKAIDEYQKERSEILEDLSKMTTRKPTEYYELAVDNFKKRIFRENIEEIKNLYRSAKNYENVSDEIKEIIDQDLETIILTGNYEANYLLEDYVEDKYFKSDWYKDNHYEKVVYKGGMSYKEMFPTALWTDSQPNDPKYMERGPNNSYYKRSINEFVTEKDGTKTRLKRMTTLPDGTQKYEINDPVFKHMTPKPVLKDGTKSKYLNPKYEKIAETNKKLLDVLTELTNMYYSAQEKPGVRNLQLYQSLPRMEASYWDIASGNGNKFQKVKEKIGTSFSVVSQDVDTGLGKGDWNDAPLRSVPTRFTSDIPYELRSKDVMGNILAFVAQSNLITKLNDFYPSAKEFHKLMNKATPAQTREGVVVFKKLFNTIKTPLKGTTNNRAEHINHLIESKILQNKRTSLKAGKYNVTKILDAVTSAASFSTLAGIVRPNIVMNYLVGKVQTWIETWSKGVINREDYNQGMRLLYQYFASDFTSDFYKLGQKSLIGQIIVRYNSQSKSMFELFGRELQKTPIKDVLSSDVFYKTRRLSEFELNSITTLALLKKIQVLDGDKQIPLLEAYILDENSNVKLKERLKKLDGTPFTKEDEANVRVKGTTINLIIQGNYSKQFVTKADTTVLLPLFTFFRKHLMSYYDKAWSEKKPHYGVDDIREGYNRTLWKTAYKLIKNINSIAGMKEVLASAKEENKPELTKALIHNGIIALISTLLLLLGDDDDEEKTMASHDSFVLKSVLYQLYRLKSDLELNSALAFYQGFEEAMSIYKTPSIVISKTGMDVVRTLNHLQEFVQYKLGIVPEKDVVLSRDYYTFKKGDLELAKDLGKLTGVTGSSLDPDAMLDKFKSINKTLYR
jgi:hypothetical protein